MSGGDSASLLRLTGPVRTGQAERARPCPLSLVPSMAGSAQSSPVTPTCTTTIAQRPNPANTQQGPQPLNISPSIPWWNILHFQLGQTTQEATKSLVAKAAPRKPLPHPTLPAPSCCGAGVQTEAEAAAGRWEHEGVPAARQLSLNLLLVTRCQSETRLVNQSRGKQEGSLVN